MTEVPSKTIEKEKKNTSEHMQHPKIAAKSNQEPEKAPMQDQTRVSVTKQSQTRGKSTKKSNSKGPLTVRQFQNLYEYSESDERSPWED